MSYTTFGTWGRGGGKRETILKYFTFDLFTFSDDIYYTIQRFHVFFFRF